MEYNWDIKKQKLKIYMKKTLWFKILKDRLCI